MLSELIEREFILVSAVPTNLNKKEFLITVQTFKLLHFILDI